MKFLEDILKPETRQYLYTILLMAMPILTATGLLTDNMAPLVIGLAGAVLAVGVASGNVNKKADGKHEAKPADETPVKPLIEEMKKSSDERAAIVEESNRNSPFTS